MHVMYLAFLLKDKFINKIKNDNEFSKQQNKVMNIIKKYEGVRNEILYNESIPQELKDKMASLNTELEMKWSEEDKIISDNIKNGKKLVGYDKETFLPIFE